MSDFAAYLPLGTVHEMPELFTQLGAIYRQQLGAVQLRSQIVGGAVVLSQIGPHQAPRFFAKDDDSGWIIVKGIIFDVDTPISESEVNLEDLLDLLLNEEMGRLNRYEGTFAVAAWDARKRRGWAVNDQASMMNLYYHQTADGCYVTTNALSLASVLKRPLDPHSVQEFLARKKLLAPASMFAGIKRVNVGEHLSFQNGHCTVGRHWSGYADEVKYRTIQEASVKLAEIIVDRMSRYLTAAHPLLCDLTGGYDSRLMACAANTTGFPFSVTVNGPPDMEDVQISQQVARETGWPMEYLDTTALWTRDISTDMRRELTYRTNGELPFNEVYHHLLTRPALSERFAIHVGGGGGSGLRYQGWSQEFFTIGRRQTANINNAIKFRFMPDKPLPGVLASQEWLPALRSRLRAQIEAICFQKTNTRTTEQLDAIHIWKATSHGSLYLSSIYNWLPSVTPYMTAGVIEATVSIPWKMRLTSQFQRHVIHYLSPKAASVITTYSGTAEPITLKNLRLEALQLINRLKKLFKKLDRVFLRGTFSKRLGLQEPTQKNDHIPFLTSELKHFMCPETMYSRNLYDQTSLRALFSGDPASWQPEVQLIAQIATIEQLCRELDFKPQGDFLLSKP